MSHEDALAGLDRMKLRKMGVSHSEGEMILHLMSILNKYGLFAKESDPVFEQSPAAKLEPHDVEILKNLPRIIAAIKKQKGEPGDPGSPGRPGKDAVVDYNDIVRRVLRKIPMPRDGRDAVIDIDDVVRKVLAKIPKPKDGKDGGASKVDEAMIRSIVIRNLPVLPQDISRSALPEFRSIRAGALDADRVVLTNASKELVTVGVTLAELEMLNGITSNIQDQLDALAGGGALPTFVDKEVPAGAINDSNTVFVLANTPSSGSEHIFLNGVLQVGGGVDYTLVDDTITFIVAPESGNRLLASYRY